MDQGLEYGLHGSTPSPGSSIFWPRPRSKSLFQKHQDLLPGVIRLGLAISFQVFVILKTIAGPVILMKRTRHSGMRQRHVQIVDIYGRRILVLISKTPRIEQPIPFTSSIGGVASSMNNILMRPP